MAAPQPATKNRTGSGFTLTELIIAAVMLLIVLGSLADIFSATNRQTMRTEQRYRQESNIDADLAFITRLNEHYTCASGNCISDQATHPGEGGFFPDVAATAAVTAFENRCTDMSNNTLLTPLIGNGGIIETQAPANEQRLPQIARVITADGHSHRYTVSYFAGNDTNGEMLRQASFVPTTAGWCPIVP